MPEIAIIGAGASGIMAAISSAQSGATVTMIEHSSTPGQKLLLTGGGRCNFTTDSTERDFVRIMGRRGRFLGHALAALSPAATRTFFDGIGVPSVVEKDGRVVPVSQRAVNVRRALLEKASSLGVRVVSDRQVLSISQADSGWDVAGDNGRARFDRVILATGGMSFAATGSDGSGYRLAAALGHRIVNPVPGEVPLITGGLQLDRLQGLTVEGVDVYCQGDRRPRTSGNILFTHFGLSGPAILDISADVAEMIAARGQTVLLLDFLPSTAMETVLEILQSGPQPLLRRLPNRLASVIGDRMPGVTAQAQSALLKAFPVTVTRTRGFDHAMVTRGGIDLSEVDPSSMQSRLRGGLYFAGEILDLDGPMGGYNLQMAWSTGFLAGKSAARD